MTGCPIPGAGFAILPGRPQPCIVDRQGSGRCPMETATANIDDPALASAAIKNTVRIAKPGMTQQSSLVYF